MEKKIIGWVARDENKNIKCLCDDCECNECYDCGECTGYSINEDEEPTKVELTIKICK